MTVSVAPTGGIIIGVWLRLALTGGLQRGYRFTWDSTNSGEFAFTSFAASSPSVLATATGISLSPGDQFGARAIGTSLIGYKNGVKVLTTSDGNSVVASQIGLTIPQTVGRVSAFGGGNL
jgi:hypothetical protein